MHICVYYTHHIYTSYEAHISFFVLLPATLASTRSDAVTHIRDSSKGTAFPAIAGSVKWPIPLCANNPQLLLDAVQKLTKSLSNSALPDGVCLHDFRGSENYSCTRISDRKVITCRGG